MSRNNQPGTDGAAQPNHNPRTPLPVKHLAFVSPQSGLGMSALGSVKGHDPAKARPTGRHWRIDHIPVMRSFRVESYTAGSKQPEHVGFIPEHRASVWSYWDSSAFASETKSEK